MLYAEVMIDYNELEIFKNFEEVQKSKMEPMDEEYFCDGIRMVFEDENTGVGEIKTFLKEQLSFECDPINVFKGKNGR